MRTMWLRPRACIIDRVTSGTPYSTIDADSHAYTFCLWTDTLKIFDYNTPVNVQGYDPALGAWEYSTILGALAFLHQYSLQRYYMVVHQAVHMPDLNHHLLCPLQCNVNGVKGNDCPRNSCVDPADTTNSIMASNKNGDEAILLFALRVVTSVMNVLPFSNTEYDEQEFTMIKLTPKELTWDPSVYVFEDQDNATVNHRGELYDRPRQRKPLMVINSVTILTPESDVDVMSVDNFVKALKSYVNVSHMDSVRPLENVSNISLLESPASSGTLYSQKKKITLIPKR